jgi:hypothetical protein
MPAGNDAQAAYSELTDRFGAGHGRAEDLIEARRDAYPEELRAAQLRGVDENATALIDDAEVADAAGVDEAAIQSKAVRGDAVIAVVEGDDGRTAKVMLPLSVFEDVAEEAGQEDSGPTAIFASDAAEEFANSKNLTAETIAVYLPDGGSGKDGSFTKSDVAKAAEAKAAAAV